MMNRRKVKKYQTLLDEMEGNCDIDRINELLLRGEVDVKARIMYMHERTTLLHVAVDTFLNGAIDELRNQSSYLSSEHTDSSSKILKSIETKLRRGPDIVDMLLQYGADVNAKDEVAQTPLHLAASKNASSLILVHLKLSQLCERSGGLFENSFFEAVVNESNVRTVKLLLLKGADVNVKNISEVTPLHCAVRERSLDVMKVLLEHGANVKAQDIGGLTPLHYAVRLDDGFSDIVKLLLDKGANVKAKDIRAQTPFHYALVAGPLDIVKLLLEHGADANIEDINKQTLLHDVAGKDSSDRVKLLLKLGANINALNSRKKTPLHCAVVGGSSAIVKLMLEHGADVKAQDSQANTPLHAAINELPYADTRGIIKLLIEYGTDLESRNQRGQTPAHLISSCLGSMDELCVERISDVLTEIFSHGADFINAEDLDGITPYNSIIRSTFGSVSLKMIAVTHIRILVALAAAHLPKKNRSLFLDITNLLSNRSTKAMHEFQVDLANVSEENGRDYYEQCNSEIERMKTIRIFEDIKLVDALTLRNPVTMAKISGIIKKYVRLEDLNRDFPIYSFLIKLQCKKSIEMELLCKECEISLEIISSGKIKTDCAYNVLQYFSEIDLKNLNEATKNVSTG